MKKFAITLIVGITFLAATSVAQAHSRHYGGFVSVAVPIGHHAYAVLGAAPYHYPASYYYAAPYARNDYRHGYKHAYRHGHKHRKKHGHKHRKKHGWYDNDYGHDYDRRRDRRGHH